MLQVRKLENNENEENNYEKIGNLCSVKKEGKQKLLKLNITLKIFKIFNSNVQYFTISN